MPGPTHRVEIVDRSGLRLRRFSHPPLDRGGSAAILGGGDVVDGFDWERSYRIVGTMEVDPVNHVVDLDNRRELMKIERVVKTDVPGEWLVYATWTGRLDRLPETATVTLGGVPVTLDGDDVTLTTGGSP